ncbi:Ribosome-binding protein 1 [Triplophysa tibetana]|uniref:Ribosome-binding protein 1 n=1 Tax=Triplophysa tibetana TaxID=1572043 RepID=A0A5A9NVH3_9TELE|nr:Ribosome-binding protein 1 [Triplophysa tibetana]
MDVYDPQTLGIVVFGGFMVFSAIGITLVSTFSMKEMSFEEALAKQRQESGKSQPQRADKKKKASEKKSKAKKKEEKPNGKLPESEAESGSEAVIEHIEPEQVPKVEPEPQPEPKPVSVAEPEINPNPAVPEHKAIHQPSAPKPEVVKCFAPAVVSVIAAPLAPSQKEKKKRKVAKVEPAPVKPVEVPEVTVKEVQNVVEVKVEAKVVSEVAALPKVEEPKTEGPTKKKSKKKSEPVVPVETVDTPQQSPFNILVSSLNNASFSEPEMQKLVEIISKKAGKDSWQLASQKGDPLAALKKQLEEKEKQFTVEQENAAAAKTRVHELTKELNSARSKMTSVETRMSSELSAREQRIAALQASLQERLKASLQEHVLEKQQLNSKIQSLQEQLENGPTAQLARLQQENSILRDALNQATSQAESRQNAELAKLRQDCLHLNQKLNERTVAQHADEDRRKALEAKMAATEEQLKQTKVSRVEGEQVLQQKLEELRQAQNSSNTLQTQLDTLKDQVKIVDELQERMHVTEAELKDKCKELETLREQLSQTPKENQTDNSEEVQQLKSSLKEREDQLTSLEAELSQLTEELDTIKNATGTHTSANNIEAEQPFENLEKDARMISLEDELQQLKEEMERMKTKSNELREKNYAAVEALAAAERLGEERFSQARAAQSEAEQRLNSFQNDATNALQTLFPQVAIETHQSNWLEAFTHEAQASLTHIQQIPEASENEESSSELTELQQKLVQSEESGRLLQAECEQHKSTLSETESMLRVLQKSVEEGELAWKSKISDAEEQRLATLDQVKVLEETIERIKAETQDTEQLKGQVMLMEAQLEKQLESITISQTYEEEMSQLKTLLSEAHSQLMSAKAEAQEQKAELSLAQIQLEDATNKLQTEENTRQQLTSDYEQVQKCVRDLEAQLEELKAPGDGPNEELKERLEKEMKLTQDLNQGATKLQDLLKSTQDELTKEKETVKSLQEQIQGKEPEESKEGTSV